MAQKQHTKKVVWDKDALARVENAPSFVRAGILKLTELRAQERGYVKITSNFLTEIRNESMLRVAKVVKSFGFEDLRMEAFDVAKQKMKKLVRKVEVIGEIENYLGARTEKKDVIIDKFKMYIDMIPEKGLPWTEEATERIARVPDFVRKMAESTIEEEAKKRKEKVITREVVEAVLTKLGSGEMGGLGMPFMPGTPETATLQPEAESEVSLSMPWSDAAQERLGRIPIEFVRKRVVARVEAFAATHGAADITLEIYEAGKGQGA